MHNINENVIANLFGVSSRTVRNWKKYGLPRYASERLSLIAGTHPDWDGYKILDGRIITPENDTVTASEISHYRWICDHAIMCEKRCSVLQSQIDSMDIVSTAVNFEASDFLKLSTL